MAKDTLVHSQQSKRQLLPQLIIQSARWLNFNSAQTVKWSNEQRND